jgi:hypothetical protein
VRRPLEIGGDVESDCVGLVFQGWRALVRSKHDTSPRHVVRRGPVGGAAVSHRRCLRCQAVTLHSTPGVFNSCRLCLRRFHVVPAVLGSAFFLCGRDVRFGGTWSLRRCWSSSSLPHGARLQHRSRVDSLLRRLLLPWLLSRGTGCGVCRLILHLGCPVFCTAVLQPRRTGSSWESCDESFRLTQRRGGNSHAR